MRFAELLRHYRSAAGFSQEHLAALARVSVESVGALERGTRRAPYRETVARLAEALGLDTMDRAKLEEAADRARARGTPRFAERETPASKPQLPLQSTSFVGRARDLAAITALLQENRLVTITGSGGVGKTRASIEVAGQLAAARGRAVHFVDLSTIGDSRFVVGTVAKRLGIPMPDVPDTVEELVAAMPSGDALIVLDNCEHLVANIALLVSASLRSCPNVSYLVTSRERLAVSGEAVYRLPSLEMPDRPVATLEHARRYAALELFVQRATMLDPFFEFTDAGVRKLIDICAKLDGIPLAIELAAARVPTLGMEALSERLDAGLRLAGGVRNLPARQQTMIATIGWSYDLLSDLEKTLLERVSVFVGGFTLAAAEAVCAGEGITSETVPELLSSLVNKSLVSIAHDEKRARYALLDSVKTFARERLAAVGQAEMLSLRHATWLAGFADWIDATRVGKSEQWLRTETAPELENVRAALAWAFQIRSRESALLAARIVGGLRTIWLVSGQRGECTHWARSALAGIDDERDAQLAAPLLRALVQSATERDIVELGKRALPVFERIGDFVAMGLVHSHVAKTYACRGRLAEAEAEILRAGEIFAGLPRAMPYSAFLQYRLQVHDRCGRFKEALFDIAEGIAIANSVGDVDAYLWQLFRAEIHFGMGKPAEALRATEAVLTHLLLREDTYVREIIVAYANLARFRLAVADVDAGIASAREALLRTRRRDLEDLSAQAMHLAAVAATLRRETRVAAKLWCSLEVRYDPEIARAWRDRDRSSMPAALQAVAYQELEAFRTGGLRQSRDAIVEEALEALEARPVSTATGTSNGVNS